MRVILLILAPTAAAAAQGVEVVRPAAEYTGAARAAWDGELRYWETRAAGKIDEYMALWHEDFTGWPAAEAGPGGKDVIRRRVEREIADTKPGSVSVRIEPLSARGYGDTAVVFYRARALRTSRSGARVEAYWRITHTWMRTPGGWRIVGGMSANEERR
jgi:ketosteroid isomerase-like protein